MSSLFANLKPTKDNKKKRSIDASDVAMLMLNDDEYTINGIYKAFAGQVWVMRKSGLWGIKTDKDAKQWLETRVLYFCANKIPDKVHPNDYVKLSEATAKLLKTSLYLPEVDELLTDRHGLIPLKNGLLDWHKNKLRDYTPDDFATFKNNADYDPAATCPNFIEMVTDIFEGDTETINALQEIIGCGLVPHRPRELNTITLFIGPSNTGKSQLLSAIMALYGDKTAAPTIESLSNSHGTEPLLQQRPWRNDEVSDGRTWEVPSILKQIGTGDPIHVNIKNGAQFSFVYLRPIFWGSNFPLQVQDETDAIVKRISIIECQREFPPELIGVAKKAREAKCSGAADYIINYMGELPGMLNWALEGLDRAYARGYLEKTEKMKRASEEMKRDTSYAYAYMRDCLEPDPHSVITLNDLYASVLEYGKDGAFKSANFTPTQGQVSGQFRHIKNAQIKDVSVNNKTRRCLVGFKMSETGLSYWSAGKVLYGSGTSLTGRLANDESEVNKRRV